MYYCICNEPLVLLEAVQASFCNMMGFPEELGLQEIKDSQIKWL
jgi:hypothetical protein